MFKVAILFAIIACLNAQSIRLNPLVIGSSQLAAERTIKLGPGGGIRLLNRPLIRQLAIPAPLVYQQPQIITRPIAAPILLQAAPQLISRQVLSAPLISDESPEPYTYAFTSVDEFGTTLNRQESAAGNGAVTGSYGYTDASGLARKVEYVADDNGFRANVITNEPGTANANPADVTIQSSAPSRR